MNTLTTPWWLKIFLFAFVAYRFIMQDSNLLFYDQKASQAPPDTKPTGWVFDPDLKGLSFAMLLCFFKHFL